MFLLLGVVIVVLSVIMYMKNHLGVEENKVTAVTVRLHSTRIAKILWDHF